MTIRTRIAPSPTGDPHVGTAYIALFNLVFARQHGGQFILRIEDTDQVRSTRASEEQILESLRWLGLGWDEGPDVGGPHGPYRQSERMSIYQQHARQLIESGHAFYCFATPDELDEMRREQQARGETPRYDGRGLELSPSEVQRRLGAGEPHVIRMKIPAEGVCVIDDMLRGKIEIPWSQVDMQVLVKADGMPTYHLANVVDDHLMEITHVIRGEEWISSAPKHQLLYRYFGWNQPLFCHMPLLRNPDKSKLSKRKNPTSINYYRRMGYLPEALLNYLGRMGWSMPDEREKFSLAEMLTSFDLQRVSLGGPVFDVDKLNWLNGQWLREDLSADALVQRFRDWAFNVDYLGQIIPHVQKRIHTLSDVVPLAGFFLAGMLDVKAQDFENAKLSADQVRQILQFSSWYLDGERAWNIENLSAGLTTIAQAMDIKMRDFMIPIFVAIAGKPQAPSITDAMGILGADISRARVRHALGVVGGPSKKEVKAWEKQYRAIFTSDSDAGE
ncbi:Glutamyl-tRNA synthetase [gamma proteobacterium HdN1]|nr:Glutamyl-tRNA synthetase [gamma proteobacterium HdN1]